MSNDEDVCCIAVSFHCTYYAEQDQAIAKYMVLIYILEMAKERERERGVPVGGRRMWGDGRNEGALAHKRIWEVGGIALFPRPSVRPSLPLPSLTDRP